MNIKRIIASEGGIKTKALIVVLFTIFIAWVFYLCCPKYEIYQSAGDGTVTYRFNRITGTLQSVDYNGWWGVKWGNTVPTGFIKKP